MKTSIVVLFITALAAAVIGLAAYIRYRRRLAAALSEDSDTSVRQHRSASPAEFIPWLLIALLVIWNGVTLGKISSTSASLDNYAGNIQSQLLALRSQVQELEEKLSAQSALLLDYDWQFGEIDSQKHQVAIIYRMTPASLPKNAQFSLLSGTQTFPCTREADGSLTATIRADLFQLITDFPLFIATEEDGTEHRQVLDKGFTGYPCEGVLPICEPVGMNLKGGVKKGTLTLEGLLKLGAVQKTPGPAVQSASLLKQQGNDFTDPLPLSLSTEDVTDLTLDERIEDFPDGVSFKLWTEVQTAAGYRVRSLILSMDADNDYSPILHYLTAWEVYGGDGRLLFRSDGSVYGK